MVSDLLMIKAIGNLIIIEFIAPPKLKSYISEILSKNCSIKRVYIETLQNSTDK